MLNRLCAFLLLSMTFASCGSGGNNTPTTPTRTPTPTQASLTLTVSPNPSTATVCSPLCVGSSGNSYSFRISGTLTIQETAGVSGNVDGIQLFTNPTHNPNEIIQRSGTNHIAAKGSLTYPVDVVYGLGANASRSIV